MEMMLEILLLGGATFISANSVITLSTSMLVTSSATFLTSMTSTPINTSNIISIISISKYHQSTKSHQKSLLKVSSLNHQSPESLQTNRYFHVSHLVKFHVGHLIGHLVNLHDQHPNHHL